MIKFDAPSGPAHTYAIDCGAMWTGGLIGPFSDDSYTHEVAFRSPWDSLDEKPGIFGENHVNHSETHGNLRWNPWLTLVKSGATTVNVVERNPDGSQRGSVVSKQIGYFNHAQPQWWRNGDSLSRWTSDASLLLQMQGVRIDAPGGLYPTGRLKVDSFSLVVASLGSHTHPSIPYMAQVLISNYHGESFELKGFKDNHESWQGVGSAMYEIAMEKQAIWSESLYSAKKWYLVNPIKPTGYESPGMVYRALSPLRDLKLDLPESKDFGDLAQEAVETLDANNVNMFEFVQGIKNPKQMLLKLKNLSKLNTHAGNYLAVQYGILPTISDLETLKEAVLKSDSKYQDSNGFQVLTSGQTVSKMTEIGMVTVVNRCKIAIDDTAPVLKGMAERLRNIGAFPDLSSLWDLVAYSFVIDWFVDIGSILEDIDSNVRMASLPIVYSTTSSKTTIDFVIPKSLTDVGIDGNLSKTDYHRSVSPRAPRPTLNFEVSNELPNHWLEAGALIITAKK